MFCTGPNAFTRSGKYNKGGGKEKGDVGGCEPTNRLCVGGEKAPEGVWLYSEKVSLGLPKLG